MKPIHRAFVALAVLVMPSVCFGQSDPVAVVLNKEDAKLKQGEVKYYYKLTEFRSPQEVSGTGTFDENQRKSMLVPSKFVVKFSENKYRKEEYEQRGTKKYEFARSHFFDGKDYILTLPATRGSSKTRFSAIEGGDKTRIGDNWLNGVQPGASAFLGRGMSNIVDMKSTCAGDKCTVSGESELNREVKDGNFKIQAQVDLARGGVASVIERFNGSQLMERITTSKPVLIENKVWVCSQAKQEVFDNNGKPITVALVRLEGAKLNTDDDFTFPIKQGVIINDDRFGQSVNYYKKTPGTITKEELAKVTRAKIETEAKIEAKANQIRLQRKIYSIAQIVCLVAVVTLLPLTLTLYLRSRRARK